MTILATQSIAGANVRMRLDEPYTSESVNRALVAAQRTGVVYGYRLVPDTGANTSVRLERDPFKERSFASIFDKARNVAVSIQDTQDVTFNLAAQAGERVHVYAWAKYTTSEATTAEFRLVDDAEIAADPDWLNRAIPMGSVYVPSSGAITVDDIEAATAMMAGIDGGLAGWSQVNENPKFNMGLAGYMVGWTGSTVTGQAGVTPGLEEDELGRTKMIRLGNASAQGSDQQARLEVSLDDFDVDDLLLIKTKAKTNGALGTGVELKVVIYGWGLNAEDQKLFEAVLTSEDREQTIADYQEYGCTFRLSDTAADASAVNLDISQIAVYLEVDVPSGVAGQYDIAELYVHRRRLKGGSASPHASIKAARAVEFVQAGGGTSGVGVPPRFYALNGALVYEDANLDGPMPLADASATKALTGSLAQDAATGAASAGIAGGLLPYAVIDGLGVSKTGATSFQVEPGTIYVEGADLGERLRDISGGTLTIASSGFELVYVDLADDTVKSASFGAITSEANRFEDKVPLATVRNTATAYVHDVALRPISLLASSPVITLGDSIPSGGNDVRRPLCTTARQACDMLRAYYQYAPFGSILSQRAAPGIIQVVGSFELGEDDRFDLVELDGVVIQGVHGEVGSEIVVSGAPTTSRFSINGRVHVRDLHIRSTGNRVDDSTLFHVSDPGHLTLTRVTTPTLSSHVWDHVITAQGASVTARDCTWSGRTLVHGGGGSVELDMAHCLFRAFGTPTGEYLLDLGSSSSAKLLDVEIIQGAGLDNLGARLQCPSSIRGLVLQSCPLELDGIDELFVDGIRIKSATNDEHTTYLTVNECEGVVRCVSAHFSTNAIGTVLEPLIDITGKADINEGHITVRDITVYLGGGRQFGTVVSVGGTRVILDGVNAHVTSFEDATSAIISLGASAQYCAVSSVVLTNSDPSSPGYGISVGGGFNRIQGVTAENLPVPIAISGNKCLVDMVVSDSGSSAAAVVDAGTDNVVGGSVVTD
jgi:hypothetical protein